MRFKRAYKKLSKSRNYTYDLMMKNQEKFIGLIGFGYLGKNGKIPIAYKTNYDIMSIRKGRTLKIDSIKNYSDVTY